MKKITVKTALTALAVIIIVAILTGGAVNAHAYKRQTNKEKSVRVDVLPVELTKGKPVKFDIKMNSHSVTLKSDIVAGSVLEDDTGVAYKALNWDGMPPGGHHRSGTLEFPVLNGNPKSITLIIKGVSNVPERIYKWTLE
jgi:hypothetical protein